MSQYAGQIVELQVGTDGLRTDDPNSVLTAGNLIISRNIDQQEGGIAKARGSMRWNETPFSFGVRGGFDWWPDESTQRLIAITSDGKIYKMPDRLTATEIGAVGGAPATINASEYTNMVAGGAEQQGNPRKLFIMTGYDPVQVLTGDSATRSSISGPVGDFSGTNQPLSGVIFRGRLIVFLRNGHSAYASSALNHEDFSTSPLPYAIYPGESERISSLFAFRGKLFAIKYPRGLYVMNDSDPSASNWFFEKLNGSFGAPTSKSEVPVFDDAYVANEYGSISSLTATNATGDVKSADLFAQLRVQSFMRDRVLQEGRGIRQGIYYPDKKIAMYTYRGLTSQYNDWLLFVDFQSTAMPKVIWHDKDQPNCLFLRKDNIGVERPFYGSEDGYLYGMDSPNRWIGTSDGAVQNGYTYEWQTPHFDLAAGNPVVGAQNKNWEFLELMYEPTGKFKVSVDVYLDSLFHKTLEFECGGRSDLDFMHLDIDTTSAEVELTSTQLPIQGMSKRISFRVYNSDPGENFKITKLRVFYKPSGQQDRKQV